jgi:hypothetical protein
VTILRQIQSSIRDAGFSLTMHALQQITARDIPVHYLRDALLSSKAVIIEDYPEDPRGPSCLVYSEISNQALHIQVSHPPEIVIISAYQPDPRIWKADLKTRK